MVWYARANHNKRTKPYTEHAKKKPNDRFIFKGNFMLIGFESCARRRLPPVKMIQHMVDCVCAAAAAVEVQVEHSGR